MSNSNLSLKAIYSRSLKSAEETAALVSVGADRPELYSADSGSGKTYQNLLLRSDITAVIIALPIVSQPEYIEAALSAGKHVLAEKPLAKDVAAAKKLLDHYYKEAASKKVSLSIAENFRFQPRFVYAADQVAHLGQVTHFNFRINSLMSQENKYYKTPWRTKPKFQGGFLLDGGVHNAAGSRFFLTGKARPSTVRAFTALTYPYLAPIDTVNAIVKTASGATGTFQQCVGTRMRAQDWDIGCEDGSVSVSGDKVTVRTADGKETTREFERTSGVQDEVDAWAQGLLTGQMDERLAPELALGDLEFLEKMFVSGEQNGAEQTYTLQ